MTALLYFIRIRRLIALLFIIHLAMLASAPLGLTASTPRKIQPLGKYAVLVPAPRGGTIEVKNDADVDDTLVEIRSIVGSTLHETQALARVLRGPDVRTSAANIYDFIYRHIRYKLDKDDVEQVRTPARTIHDQTGDCDCMTTLASSLLTNMGIEHVLRVTAYENREYFQHIYVVAFDERGAEVVIDPVVEDFNYEEPYTYKRDVSMKLHRLDGPPSPNTGIIPPQMVAAVNRHNFEQQARATEILGYNPEMPELRGPAAVRALRDAANAMGTEAEAARVEELNVLAFASGIRARAGLAGPDPGPPGGDGGVSEEDLQTAIRFFKNISEDTNTSGAGNFNDANPDARSDKASKAMLGDSAAVASLAVSCAAAVIVPTSPFILACAGQAAVMFLPAALDWLKLGFGRNKERTCADLMYGIKTCSRHSGTTFKKFLENHPYAEHVLNDALLRCIADPEWYASVGSTLDGAGKAAQWVATEVQGGHIPFPEQGQIVASVARKVSEWAPLFNPALGKWDVLRPLFATWMRDYYRPSAPDFAGGYPNGPWGVYLYLADNGWKESDFPPGYLESMNVLYGYDFANAKSGANANTVTVATAGLMAAGIGLKLASLA